MRLCQLRNGYGLPSGRTKASPPLRPIRVAGTPAAWRRGQQRRRVRTASR